MADVSQLEINGTTYDICDAIARDSASQRLPLSGGTLTGSLRVQSTNIDRDGADPSSAISDNSFILNDKDGEGIGIIRPTRQTTGRQDLYIMARNENSSGNQVENTLRIGVDKDGTCSYFVSDASAFRDAIGALSVSGGTVTGRLDVEGVLGFSFSGSNKCALNRSGDYVYMTALDGNGNGIGCYRFNMADWGIVYRPWTNGAWGNWESHLWNALASRTANTVLAAPNGSAGTATFRKLVPDDCSWLGTRKSDEQSSAKSIADSSWTAIASVSLTAGIWVVTGSIVFASNSTGRRYACINNESPTSQAQRQSASNSNAVSGSQTILNVGCIKGPSSTSTYSIYGYQTSGSALNGYGYITAIRIA